MPNDVRVELYFHNRDKTLVAYIKDTTPDAINLAWTEAVHNDMKLFTLTDANGSRLSIRVNRVEMLVASSYNLGH